MKLRALFLVPLVLAVPLAVPLAAAPPLQSQPAAPPVVAPAPAPPAESADSVRRIGIPEALQALKDGKAVFVDVRAEYDFNLSHVQGALHIPAGDMAQRAKELPRDRFIITYCT
jgi:hypothetical protein